MASINIIRMINMILRKLEALDYCMLRNPFHAKQILLGWVNNIYLQMNTNTGDLTGYTDNGCENIATFGFPANPNTKLNIDNIYIRP